MDISTFIRLAVLDSALSNREAESTYLPNKFEEGNIT